MVLIYSIYKALLLIKKMLKRLCSVIIQAF